MCTAYVFVLLKLGLIQVLSIPIKEYVGVKSILTLISILRVVNSLKKESQELRKLNSDHKDFTNVGTLFAKFAQVNFSG